MAQGPHSHWERYIERIIPIHHHTMNGSYIDGENLQLICIDDGIIFHQVEIKKER